MQRQEWRETAWHNDRAAGWVFGGKEITGRTNNMGNNIREKKSGTNA